VPVTAKLSRRFYEKFGDEIANELVDWFNMVDGTYRSDLRELNEQNFSRFDATVERRLAEQDARIERRFAALDAKTDQRIADVRAEMQTGFARLEAAIKVAVADVDVRMTKRLFGFWVAQAATTVGLIFGILKLLQA